MRISKDQNPSREASFKVEKSTEAYVDEIEAKICERNENGVREIQRQTAFQMF